MNGNSLFNFSKKGMHVSVMNSKREARYPDLGSLSNFSKKGVHVSLMNPEREVRYPDPVSLFNFSKKKGCTYL